jgi:hypothetical protein
MVHIKQSHQFILCRLTRYWHREVTQQTGIYTAVCYRIAGQMIQCVTKGFIMQAENSFDVNLMASLISLELWIKLASLSHHIHTDPLSFQY